MEFNDLSQKILESTNGGLDIILDYYPQAADTINRNSKNFKIRPEKTASASIKRLGDGNWVVTDWGNDSKPKNAIAISMELEKRKFEDTLSILIQRYNIQSENAKIEKPAAKITSKPASADQEDGQWYFDFKKSFSDSDIKTIIAPMLLKDKHISYEKIAGTFKRYKFTALASYTIIKERKAITISATETYPIFCFDYGDWKKIYQPLSAEKSRRFMYYGGRPKDYIHGLDIVEKEFDSLSAGEEGLEMESEADMPKKKHQKLPEVIICSGGSDALNVALLGYQVIWLNSETAHLPEKVFNRLVQMCNNVYWLGDIDTTGKKESHEMALEYLDLKIIELPESMLFRRDFRGNPCKDVRDFFRYYGRKKFSEIVKEALPYAFWTLVPKYDKNGEFVRNTYMVNNVLFYNFLAKMGFHRYRPGSESDGWSFIHIDGNIVREINPNEIKNFIHEFLKERKLDLELRNNFYRTNQLNESSLSNLPLKEIEFTDFDKHTQFLFFRNGVWEITAHKIHHHKPGEIQKFVWDTTVLDHDAKLLEDYFKISYDQEEEEYQIEILNTDCKLFQYLINTTRMHWKVEEFGVEELDVKGNKKSRTKLTPSEIKEQNNHLINRIYALGYLLFGYKEESKPYAVFALENKLTDEDESNGGSGKSIFMNIPTYFKRSVVLNGRNPDLTKNPHFLEKVTENTGYVLVDDCDQYLRFSDFFTMITGSWDINPKFKRSFSLPYRKAPKLGFSSNFGLRNVDQSTERRILYTVFSDYYHHGGEGKEFLEARNPFIEFGTNLFTDFTAEDWNKASNLVAQCIRFFISVDKKIDPPMSKVEKRTLLAEMGDVFKAWADVYFSDKKNTLLVKKDAFELCIQENKLKWTSQKFRKALKAWCKFNEFELNPNDLKNSDGRIIRKHENHATEMIYIQTKDAEINSSDLEPNKIEPNAKLPF